MFKYLLKILSLIAVLVLVQSCGKSDSNGKKEMTSRPEAITANGDLASLLTSSAWCNWEFKQIGIPNTDAPVGTVEKEIHAAFQKNGTLVLDTLTRRTNSGTNGDYSGETPDRQTLQWKTKANSLLLSEDNANWEEYPVTVRGNFLIIEGKEWKACN